VAVIVHLKEWWQIPIKRLGLRGNEKTMVTTFVMVIVAATGFYASGNGITSGLMVVIAIEAAPALTLPNMYIQGSVSHN